MVKFDDSNGGFLALFTKAVDDIYENYQYKLYEVEVAKEFADVNARILQQSYLSGDHATGVAPFIFHSETAIEKLKNTKLKEEFRGLKYGFEQDKWRWRFLLIDDKAIEKEDGKLKGNCKLSIIMRLIEKNLFPGKSNWVQYRLFEQQNGKLEYSEKAMTIDDNARIVIDCVQHYDDAIAALKNRIYDIILLDYLLDTKEGQRKYGYEILAEINRFKKIKEQFKRFCSINHSTYEEKAKLLRELISKETVPNNTENYELKVFLKTIKVDNNNITQDFITEDRIEDIYDSIQTEIETKQFKIGSNKKLFFIFISAYSTAVNERLLSMGLGRRENHWFINTGACPTNTPQLFTYNLLHLMNHRLDDCGILKLSTDEILKLVEIVFKPTKKVGDKKDSVRKKASLYYYKVLNLQYHYRKMLDDVEIPPNYDIQPESIFGIKKSVLISYYNVHQHLSGLLEHLTNLVHIAAFGTIRQWDEMWEEYLYFKAAMCKVNNSLKNDKSFNDVCEHIESFILGLKSQQR